MATTIVLTFKYSHCIRPKRYWSCMRNLHYSEIKKQTFNFLYHVFENIHILIITIIAYLGFIFIILGRIMLERGHMNKLSSNVFEENNNATILNHMVDTLWPKENSVRHY